jgi:hypothetical protein
MYDHHVAGQKGGGTRGSVLRVRCQTTTRETQTFLIRGHIAALVRSLADHLVATAVGCRPPDGGRRLVRGTTAGE